MISRVEAKNIAGGVLRNTFDIEDLLKVKKRLCSEESVAHNTLTVSFGVFDDEKAEDGKTYASVILTVEVNMKDATTKITFKNDEILQKAS